MLAPDTLTFLRSGCAMVVGTVGADGAPTAARGWGMTGVTGGHADARLLLDAGEAVALENLTTTGRIAVTAGDVRTLSTIQLKGEVVAVEDATDADRAEAARFADAFFGNVHEVDGTDLVLLELLAPREVVACLLVVSEIFDQTPGPGAGTALSTDAS